MLKCWGFSERFQRLIFSCLSSVTYSVLINRSCVGEVEPARGLRQGDPLAPYLFILCTDILSRLLEANPNVQGIKVGQNSLAISHFLYADDLLLARRENIRSARAIWECLDLFFRWSRQQVNRKKSSILFSARMSREGNRQIYDMWGLRGMKESSIYLGNALVLGKNHRKEFGKLNDRVQNRLEEWQSKLLSKADKATLIKAIVQAIPVYTMSTFKIPKGICDDLDTLVIRFWWGTKHGSNRFLALKSLRDIFWSKESGGLGFQKIQEYQYGAFIQVRMDANQRRKQTLGGCSEKEIFARGLFFSCDCKKGDSSIWNGILSTREIIMRGVCYKIGNGWGYKLKK